MLQNLPKLVSKPGFHFLGATSRLFLLCWLTGLMLPLETSAFSEASRLADKAKVGELQVIGLDEREGREFQQWLRTLQGQTLSALDLRQYGLDLLKRLHTRGFYFASVDSIKFYYSQDSTTVDVALHLSEGPKLLVNRFEVLSVQESDLSILTELATKRGKVFSEQLLEADIALLMRHYENRGYPHCKIEIAELSTAQDSSENGWSVNVVLNVVTGPLTELGIIEVNGNEATKDYVILRELGIRAGDKYDQRRVDKVPLNLSKLGFFKWVNPPRLEWRRDGIAKLIIELAEGTHNRFDGVIGYNPPTSNSSGFVTGLISVAFRNLLGTGRKAEIFWQRRTQKTQELKLHYVEPWVAGLPLNLGLSFAQLIQDTTYIQRSFGMEARLRLNDHLTLFTEFARRSVSPDSLGAILFNIQRSRSLNLRLGVGFNTLDYLPNPSAGVSYESAFEWRRKRVLSSRFDANTDEELGSFNQRVIAIDLETYISPLRWQVFALGLHGREIRSDEDAIAISDQFRLGGTRDLRGYREEQFRSSRIAWANIEYRYLLNRNSRLFSFVDIGYFSPEGEPSSIDAAKIGFGFGMRIDTKLGFFGIDYGLGEGDSLSNGKVHISLQNEF